MLSDTIRQCLSTSLRPIACRSILPVTSGLAQRLALMSFKLLTIGSNVVTFQPAFASASEYVPILPPMSNLRSHTAATKTTLCETASTGATVGNYLSWSCELTSTSKVPKLMGFVPKMRGVWAIILGTLEVQVSAK